MAAYVDFEFYTGTFNGTAIASSNDFERLELRARAVIDQVSFERAAPIVEAATDEGAIEKIKLATCAVAEEIQRLDANESGGEVASERVGNYSVTYARGTANLSDEAKLARAAKRWLAGTGLMYRGL